MTRDERPLLCWRCGADVESVPRPFSRFAECPSCRCELHVCKMCRHYAPRYVGQCDHEFADKVLEKEKSNFCGHFKPDPGAYRGAAHPEKERAQEALKTLFDENGPDSGTVEQEQEQESEADAARKRLDDLFGKD